MYAEHPCCVHPQPHHLFFCLPLFTVVAIVCLFVCLFVSQQRKLELECRLEEERMKIESEKTTLEKDKVALQTRVKQLGEQSE